MSDLVGNPENRFSRDAACFIVFVLFDLLIYVSLVGWPEDLQPRLTHVTAEAMSGLFLNQRKSKNGSRNIS